MNTAMPTGLIALDLPVPPMLETALRLATGTPLTFAGERLGERCRVRLIDGDEQADNDTLVWLDCIVVEVQP